MRKTFHLKNGSGYDHNYLLKKQPDGLCKGIQPFQRDFARVQDQ